MWLLTNINQEENTHYLICGSSLYVSRDGPGHILLRGDKTVSKVHASISLTYIDKHLNIPEKLPEVILCDLKSTNGTYLQSGSKDFVRLTSNEPVILKHGDLVKFGRNKTFRLQHEPLIVTSSQITSKLIKEKLKESVKCLGAHLVKEWNSACSLLVMNELVLTTKTVCALASGTHIVTPDYLIDMIGAVKINDPLPDKKKYMPILKEPSINSAEVSFFPEPMRRKLFSDKIFYFQNEVSHKKMKGSVEEAGGSAFILSETNYKDVINENSLLIKSAEKEVTNLPNFIISCLELLKDGGLHPIPESDIGLAVVYCSTEKYCNPKFRISCILQPSINESQQTQKLIVFATETQQETQDVPSIPVSRTIIPESGESSKSRNSLTSKNPSLSSTKISLEANGFTDVTMESIGKRKRVLNDSHSPDTKSQEPKGKKRHEESTLTVTEEITIDDEADKDIHFNPRLCSTEKMSQNASIGKRKADQFAFPEPLPVRKNVRIGSNLSINHDSIDNSCIPKSIPFDPYTLPSISTDNFSTVEPSVDENEDDIETQPFLDSSVIKQEPKSQSYSQPVKEKEAQTREKIVSNDDWISANEAKSQKKSPEKRELASTSFTKPLTENLKKENNDFALPCSTQRKRRTRMESNEISAEINNPKRTKIEANNTKNETSNLERVVIKRSPSELAEEKTSHHVDEKIQPFISKNCSTKKESTDEVSELGQTLERSLVVVEVVSLIRKVDGKTNVNTTTSSNGFPNFKKFRKVLPHNTSIDDDEIQPVLPRIIGGHDLVFHSDVRSRRESFIATQPDLQEHLETRETDLREKNTADDKFDADFGFTSNVRSRRKGRL